MTTYTIYKLPKGTYTPIEIYPKGLSKWEAMCTLKQLQDFFTNINNDHDDHWFIAEDQDFTLTEC
jgi:hypothetical protein